MRSARPSRRHRPARTAAPPGPAPPPAAAGAAPPPPPRGGGDGPGRGGSPQCRAEHLLRRPRREPQPLTLGALLLRGSVARGSVAQDMGRAVGGIGVGSTVSPAR